MTISLLTTMSQSIVSCACVPPPEEIERKIHGQPDGGSPVVTPVDVAWPPLSVDPQANLPLEALPMTTVAKSESSSLTSGPAPAQPQQPGASDLQKFSEVEIRGIIQGIVQGEYNGTPGCWVISQVPGEEGVPPEASFHFMTPAGEAAVPVLLPHAGQRSYGASPLWMNGHLLASYQSTAGFAGQDGRHHGLWVGLPDGEFYDFNLFETDSLTRPVGMVPFQDPLSLSAHVLFNNGSTRMEAGRVVFEDSPSLVHIDVARGTIASIRDIALPERNASGVAASGNGRLAMTYAGGAYDHTRGGSFAVLDPETQGVTAPIAIPGAAGMGFVVKGHNAWLVSGYSVAGLTLTLVPQARRQSPPQTINVAALTGLTGHQFLGAASMPFSASVYIRMSEGGYSRTFRFNPDDYARNPAMQAEEMGEPIGAEFTFPFTEYGREAISGVRLFCTADAATSYVVEEVNGVPRTVENSRVTFFQEVKE